MATRTVKARVELDGERQYKQALSELQKGNQVLSSEMKKLQAQYKGNTESTEFLTKKGDLLQRQLLQQKDVVSTLREALKNAASQTKESSKEVQDWQIKLNKAEAAQYDLEHAIQENTEALKRENTGMKNTGDVSAGLTSKVKDLAEQFGLKLPAGLDKALGSTELFSKGSVTALAVVTGAVTGLVKIYQRLFDMTMDAAARADETMTLAKVTGLDPDTIQAMQYGAELLDVSFDVIQGSLTKLKRNMADARDGNEKLLASFHRLNIIVTDSNGQLRDSEEVFYEAIDALSKVQNATERDALAMALFGRSAEELNPLIMEGSDALRELYKEADNVNYILSGDTLQALTDVDDAYQRLQKTQQAVHDEMAGQLAPGVEELHKVWADFVKEGGELLVRSGIIKGLGEILTTVVDLLQPLTDLIGLMTPAKDQFSLVYEVLHGIAMTLAWIEDTADAFIGIFTYAFDGGERWNTAMGWNASRGQFSHMQQINGTQAHYESAAAASRYNASTGRWEGNYAGSENVMTSWTSEDYGRYTWDDNRQSWYDNDEKRWIPGNATGTPNWRGGLTWVGENGPELVGLPSGSQVMNAQDSRRAGGDVFNITIPARDIKEFNDIVRIAESARILARMGG